MSNNKLVSVIVACYNPKLEQLFSTLQSILIQIGIDYEIIIADDGSKNDYEKQLVDFFEKSNYRDYKIIKSEVNKGTCKNILNGLKISNGKYIKLISPGDLLYCEYTLRDWVSFTEIEKCKISFGRSVYYNVIEDEINILRVKDTPQITKIYSKHQFTRNKAILNYILLKDVAIGADFLCEKQLFEDYLIEISERIVYAEDMAYRLMLVDGVKMYAYDNPVIYYEYGSGISTNGSEKWERIINNEISQINQIIVDRIKKHTTVFDKKLSFILPLFGIKSKENLKYLVFPSLIYWKLKKEKQKKYSIVQVNKEDLKKCLMK